jgi:hypothetical protein
MCPLLILFFKVRLAKNKNKERNYEPNQP